MTRPTILDLDLVVVPREATDDMTLEGMSATDSPFYSDIEIHYRSAVSASPYPTAWDDVRKAYGELEAKVAFTMTDTSRMLRKSDIKDVCPHPDDCFYESERVRCGPCAVKASKLAGIEIDDTHSHLPEVCRLRREVKAAEARIAELEAAIKARENGLRVQVENHTCALRRIAELEKRLADAEQVIEPFADCASEWDGEPDSLHVFFGWNDERKPVPSLPVADFRAARAYMGEVMTY